VRTGSDNQFSATNATPVGLALGEVRPACWSPFYLSDTNARTD